MDTEDLRRMLLEDAYAGSFGGFPAMILDEDRIRSAGPEELVEIAREHGWDVYIL